MNPSDTASGVNIGATITVSKTQGNLRKLAVPAGHRLGYGRWYSDVE